MRHMTKKFLILILTAVCFLHLPVKAGANERYPEQKGCAVSIALDVSGSMKKTDAQRYSIELIKMFIDICSADDYVNVTAYNDAVVYTSGPVSMREAADKEALKEKLDTIEFAGETDNGLGLAAAVRAVTQEELNCSRSFVLLISDGNTDLLNSNSGRTLEDSNEDMNTSSSLAREHGTAINVIEYTSQYSQDTSLLSVVTAATGGATNMVDNPSQFIQVMTSTFFTGYNGGKADLSVTNNGELLNRSQFPVTSQEDTRNYAVIFSTEKMEDFELTATSSEISYILGEHYAVFQTDAKTQETITALYSFKEPAAIISGTISCDIEKPKETTVIESEPEQPSQAPKGKSLEQKVYTSKEKLQIDISQMFSDEDQDIVSYSIQGASDIAGQGELSGSMLSADISEAGIDTYKIAATDSRQNTAYAELSIEILPAWKRYYGFIVAGIVLVIAAAATAVCILIMKKLLYRKEKELPGIYGILEAKFIDLKSKNEAVDMKWNLEEYPPEGVSLHELFAGLSIGEDLKDLDRICFYPSQRKNELVLVHCMEGGVFIGEHLIGANIPVKLHAGDVIFLSFAENASEIEIQYGKADS